MNVTASETGARGNKVAHRRGEEGTRNRTEDAENKVAPVSLTTSMAWRWDSEKDLSVSRLHDVVFCYCACFLSYELEWITSLA